LPRHETVARIRDGGKHARMAPQEYELDEVSLAGM
jgi:hypothetical protein